ncbi:MAG: hypothetical protein Q7U94_07335 [Sideroxyarcus sp.]|nr:hypothetical protein [Sideroxyarcus sp.]
MAFDTDRTGTWFVYGNTISTQAAGPRFADHLAARFPKVAAIIEEADFGVLPVEVDALKLATREAIQKKDWPTASAHFAFVDEILESAGTELHEAIGISYLTNLFYGETSPEFAMARTLMPKRLAAALELMERHYEELR